MSLAVGSRIGSYEVIGPLGAGGMGEVYRARDAKLDRDVALKILPPAFANDPDRLARFRREAQALAALNHPNIGQIYGFEDSPSTGPEQARHALVLELVEGPTLADAIAQRELGARGFGITPSLDIARQIADALDAAHAQGIVHRDLKPANIKLKDDGVVKVLDFGLAKALDPPASGPSSNAANSPTITSQGTALGLILGTAGYMAPEQAMGKTVDRRADIWAFGVILYEMLSGTRLFHGDDAGALITQVITAEPDWHALPADTPPAIHRLLRRCLEKNPRKRLRDIGDARLELDDRDPAAAPGGRVDEGGSDQRRRAWIPWTLAAASTIALAVVAFRPPPPAAAAPRLRVGIEPPEGWSRPIDFALAPDGQSLAFTSTSRGQSAIWVRAFASLRPTQLPNSQNAHGIFWSPDSKAIGFFANSQIVSVDVASGVMTVACETRALAGAAWGRGGAIAYDDGQGPIRVCGREQPVTSLAGAETNHRWPSFLPDGKHFVYLSIAPKGAELRVGSINPGEATVVIGPSDSGGLYSHGHILFARSLAPLAQPFDPERLVARGEPFRIMDESVAMGVAERHLFLSASDSGVLAFRARDERQAQLTWVNRQGVAVGTVGAPNAFFNLDLSPDEQRLVVSQRVVAPQSTDIWILDLGRDGQASRITDNAAAEYDPIWSPDGRTIVFNSNRLGPFALFQRPADASGEDTLLLKTDGSASAPDWSPTSALLVYSVGAFGVSGDIWTVPLTGEKKPVPLLTTSFDESQPAFSPDGRWLAYDSNVSGRSEVYIRALAGTASTVAVSVEGGRAPRWRGDGHEIFFVAPDGAMMAASINTAPVLRASVPQRLFAADIANEGHPYVVTKDGQRFLFGVRARAGVAPAITVDTNWLPGARR